MVRYIYFYIYIFTYWHLLGFENIIQRQRKRFELFPSNLILTDLFLLVKSTSSTDFVWFYSTFTISCFNFSSSMASNQLSSVQTSGQARRMVTPSRAMVETEFKSASGISYSSYEDLLLASMLEHKEKKQKFDEAALCSLLEQERFAAELRARGVTLDLGLSPVAAWPLDGSRGSEIEGPKTSEGGSAIREAILTDLREEFKVQMEAELGKATLLLKQANAVEGSTLAVTKGWSRSFLDSLKEAPAGGQTTSDATTGVSVFNADGLLVSKGVVKADNQLAAHALGSLLVHRVTSRLRVNLTTDMGGLLLSQAKTDEFVDLGLSMDLSSVDEDELASLASLHSLKDAHVLAKGSGGHFDVMGQVFKGQFSANALTSDSGEPDFRVGLSVLSVLAENFPRSAADVKSAFVVLVVHQWQLFFQTVFGEGAKAEEKWSLAFGDFVSVMRSGTNAVLPGGFVLEALAKQLGKWFRKVRAEFTPNGTRTAFTTLSSAVLLLKDLLAQTDLSGQAMQLYECRVKQGVSLRCVVGPGTRVAGGGGKQGTQTCLAQVCTDLLQGNPCPWLVCSPGCTRRHISAVEALELKSDIRDLIENLFRVDPKMKAELSKRFDDFVAKH